MYRDSKYDHYQRFVFHSFSPAPVNCGEGGAWKTHSATLTFLWHPLMLWAWIGKCAAKVGNQCRRLTTKNLLERGESREITPRKWQNVADPAFHIRIKRNQTFIMFRVKVRFFVRLSLDDQTARSEWVSRCVYFFRVALEAWTELSKRFLVNGGICHGHKCNKEFLLQEASVYAKHITSFYGSIVIDSKRLRCLRKLLF